MLINQHELAQIKRNNFLKQVKNNEKLAKTKVKNNMIELYGIISTLNDKYGFITISSNMYKKIPWKHNNPTKIFFYNNNDLPYNISINEKVKFLIMNDDILQTYAIDIKILKHVEQLTMINNPKYLYEYPYLVKDTYIPNIYEEDKYTEFKSLISSKSPEKLFITLAEKYLNAFLNTNGGTLYGGIENNGLIYGLYLNREQKDQLRLGIDNIVKNFKPKIRSNCVQVKFIPLVREFDASLSLYVKLDSAYIIAVQIIQPEHFDINFSIYVNRDNTAYERLSSSIRKLTNQEIKEKQLLQAQYEERNKQLYVEEKLNQTKNVLDDNALHIINQLVEMGFNSKKVRRLCIQRKLQQKSISLESIINQL